MRSPVYRSMAEPIRAGLDWHATWQGPDKGLIKNWEVGRTLANDDDLAVRARAGELPPLNWKGGVAKKLQKPEKFGSLRYLAQWLGLRGEDLLLDMDAEVTLTCSKTGMMVTFTPDIYKLAAQQGDENIEDGSSNSRYVPGVPEQSLFS